jgi:hypothetical protein
MTTENIEQNKPVSPPTDRECLEAGLRTFQEVLKQKVSVDRDQMFSLINFEVAVNKLIYALKSMEGKTREEVLDVIKENKQVEVQ